MSRILKPFKRSPSLLTIFVLGTGLLLSGCTEETRAETTSINQWLPITIGGKSIDVQIAYKDTEMAKGLMYRTSLGENRGMIFYYHPPKQMSFWMRNTKIPLDIGFFTADGVLREVYPMYPMDERSVKSRRDDLLIALEMNQGWFAKNGIKPGDAFDLEVLKKALKSRGVSDSIIPF